ncbi:auxin-induced protein 15A-like [Canna indica]|uniref:Auxin-induced protein 15A-like n=1 Tax=Canna indica TaxID=4628 RepID=A0AAQ3QJ23_9LILI|nr:auxin-induced protein 15A-like [Canna indica]
MAMVRLPALVHGHGTLPLLSSFTPSSTQHVPPHPMSTVLKQILKRCSSSGRGEEEEDVLPVDVPKGHFIVYVGERRSRFIVPISYLDRLEF